MNINLQLTLNRLGPAYKPGHPYYSLLLTAGFGDAADGTHANAVQYLQPWNWTIAGLKVVDAAHGMAAVPFDPAPAPILSGIDALKGRLLQELGDQSAALASFVLTNDPVTVNITGETPAAARATRPWFVSLAHLGTLANGISSALQLSFFFALRTEPPADAIILAAPVLEFPGLGATFEPDTATPAGGTYTWQYKSSVADPAVSAFLKPAVKPVTDPAAVIDIATLLPTANQVTYASDWQRQLHETLAPAFDGPGLLLQYCRRNPDLTSLTAARTQLVAVCRTLFARTLSEESESPDGNSVRTSILKKVATTIKVDIRDLQTPAAYTLPLPGFDNQATDARVFLEAIEKAVSSLMTPAGTAAILVDLWQNSYPAAFAKQPAFAQKLLDEAQRRQPYFQLVLETVGDHWTDIIKPNVPLEPGKELAAVRANALAAAVAFGASIWPGHLDAIATSTVEGILPMDASGVVQQPPQLSSNPAAEGLTVQVDSLAALPKDTAQDAADYHRLLSGSLLLLRRAPLPGVAKTPWRCAHHTDIQFSPGGGALVSIKGNGPLVAPSRFQYANNTRNAFLTYNGHPMVAESPLARLAAGPAPGDGDPNRDMQSLFSHKNPYGLSETAPRLERLIYGEKYEVATAYMGTAGNLPAQLVDTTAAIPFPAAFALPGPDVALPSVNVMCLRRAPVGEFRTGTNGNDRQAFPPPIPAGVVPRYRPADNATDGTYRPEHDPLILLLPPLDGGADPWIRTGTNASSASFLLYPPTVDIKVWDRWQQTTDDLADVLTDHYTLLSQQQLGLELGLSPYPDEPAVTGFTVSVVRADGAADALDALPVTFAHSATAKPLGKFQKPGVPIKVQSVTAPRKPDGNARGVNIYIPAGQIWRVDFTPIFTAQERFETAPDPAKAKYSMVVEVARPLFSTPEERLKRCQELYDSLDAALTKDSVSREPGPQKDGLAFSITLKDLKQDYQKDFYRTELSLQQWLWDGRPLYELDAKGQFQKQLRSGFPFARTGALDSTFSGDGMLFATRFDSDSAIHGSFVDYADPVKPKNEVFRRDLSSLQGAQYFRFFLRAYSRYAPLLTPSHFLDSSLQKDNATHWSRFVVPCRFNQLIPKPAIQIIFPLTESLSRGQDTYPGFLVTLNESWYSEETAGMAEFLDSEIVQVGQPDFPDIKRYQFGPDPVIDMSPDPYEHFQVSLPRPEGAIGSTFDDPGGPAPEFVRASFFQPAPLLTDLIGSTATQDQDLSFHFLKVRFRRAIVAGDLAVDGMRETACQFGAWSDAQWVQILPAANRWRCQFFQNNAWETDVQWINFTADDGVSFSMPLGSFTYRKRQFVPLTTARPPRPDSEGTPAQRFSLFLAITRVVSDVFGRRDQEALLHIFPLNDLTPLKWTETGLFLARIVEVQHRDALSLTNAADGISADDLANLLFPQREVQKTWVMNRAAVVDQMPDAPARIVRISPAIQVL